MYDQCMEVGPKYCIQVKYEDLVLHPRPTLKKILEFADLEWTENVMEHQKHMEHISLSAVEKSTDQVIKEMISKNMFLTKMGHLGVSSTISDHVIKPILGSPRSKKFQLIALL